MDVFLVPVGPRSHLYVEAAHEDAAPASVAGPSFRERQVQRFQSMLSEAERDRLRRERGETSEGGGLWRFIMRKIAETVAEQRLLWHLRHQTAVRLVHPDDMRAAEALAEARRQCAEDFGKHRRWLIIHVVTAVVTGVVLFLVPGPNLVAYYFVFRAVGHYFAWRGARQGLDRVDWRAESHAALTELRAALTLPAADRERRVRDLAERLRLQHLSAFFERVVVSPS
jgi:hypothetical protein